MQERQLEPLPWAIPYGLLTLFPMFLTFLTRFVINSRQKGVPIPSVSPMVGDIPCRKVLFLSRGVKVVNSVIPAVSGRKRPVSKGLFTCFDQEMSLIPAQELSQPRLFPLCNARFVSRTVNNVLIPCCALFLIFLPLLAQTRL